MTVFVISFLLKYGVDVGFTKGYDIMIYNGFP